MKQVLIYIAFIVFLSLPSLLRAQTLSPAGLAFTTAAAEYIEVKPVVPEKIKNLKLLGSNRRPKGTSETVEKRGAND